MKQGANTKWLFEPAGGGFLRFYIRMNVSPAAAVPALTPALQERVVAGCPRSYLAMHATNCDDTATWLSSKANTTASLVWLIEVTPQSGTDAPALGTSAAQRWRAERPLNWLCQCQWQWLLYQRQ